MGNKTVSIFQQAVYEDSKLFIEARTQITDAVYVMHEGIVQCNTQLGNISYVASGQRKWKTDINGGRRKQMCKE